ncbi:MAG: hypothetical protein E7256_17305 [Lachnospiraceae bacterium]|nr:hypothetical protein [Lachnospiraceae bacterium]
MTSIVKTYKQSVPKMRFIGKKYGNEDRVDGMYGYHWGKWFENGWFERIEEAAGKHKELYQDGDAYIGLMKSAEGQPFEYWIGMFVSPDIQAPDGFEYLDFEEGNLGVSWIKGPESEVYCKEEECMNKMTEQGMELTSDGKAGNPLWFFERYSCPRFTTPDINGDIILDICTFVK